MKKLLFAALFAGSLVFTSCGSTDPAVLDSFAEDMCAAMEAYNPDDPMTMMDAATKMLEVTTKSEYSGISEAEGMGALEDKCPEGAKKYKDLSQQ